MDAGWPYLPVHGTADRALEAQACAARAVEADTAVQVRRTRGRVPVRRNCKTARPITIRGQQRPYTRVQEDLTMMTGGVHTGTTNPAGDTRGTVFPAAAIPGRAERNSGERPSQIRRRLSDHVPGRERLRG